MATIRRVVIAIIVLFALFTFAPVIGDLVVWGRDEMRDMIPRRATPTQVAAPPAAAPTVTPAPAGNPGGGAPSAPKPPPQSGGPSQPGIPGGIVDQAPSWCSGPCTGRFEPLKESNGLINPKGVHLKTGEPVAIRLPKGYTAHVWDCFNSSTVDGGDNTSLPQVCEASIRAS